MHITPCDVLISPKLLPTGCFYVLRQGEQSLPARMLKVCTQRGMRLAGKRFAEKMEKNLKKLEKSFYVSLYISQRGDKMDEKGRKKCI